MIGKSSREQILNVELKEASSKESVALHVPNVGVDQLHRPSSNRINQGLKAEEYE